MFGLIWFVQIVHYPLFHWVGRDGFCEYERRHQRLTTWVVAPLMIGELVSSVLLLFQLDGVRWTWAFVGFCLVLLNWLSTIFLLVPCHRSLQDAYDEAVVCRLVRANWIRTFAWTARVYVAVYLLT